MGQEFAQLDDARNRATFHAVSKPFANLYGKKDARPLVNAGHALHMNFALQGTRWVSSKCFDHEPTDMELTCLLDAPRSLGMSNFEIVETFGAFRVVPARMPAFWIMVSMILGAAFLTALPLILRFTVWSKENSLSLDVILGIWMAGIWLIIIPLGAIVLAVVNRHLAEAGDFLRVDMTGRVLELCRAGRTVPSAEILAFTEVSRYFRYDRRWGEWMGKRQTGVLVSAANGGAELIALMDGPSHPPLADRLANIFKVPVRRIKLSRDESRALEDC
jgi:hypothetical protein